jgi:hypothetical protein
MMSLTNFRSAKQNNDARTADHADRQERLDRYEERLAERERAVSRREKLLDQKEQPTASTAPAPSLLRATDRPPVGNLSLADQIIRAGQIRRGEITKQSSLPEGLAGDILRAGMKARGELIEDHEPSTLAERTAALIIEAGRRRRGEI